MKRRLESKSEEAECYSCPEGFVADIRLIFINCAKYYKVNESVICKNLILSL